MHGLDRSKADDRSQSDGSQLDNVILDLQDFQQFKRDVRNSDWNDDAVAEQVGGGSRVSLSHNTVENDHRQRDLQKELNQDELSTANAA